MMTDNRTTELRRLLDECGMEYREHGGVSTGAMESYTRFVIDGDDGMVKAILETSEHSKAVLLTLRCTPEQAVAATLRRGKCEIRKLPDGYYMTAAVECSECGAAIATADIEYECCDINFCPSCGKAVKR